MSIKHNIRAYEAILAPYNARLIAVGKTKPNEDLLQAYQAGQRDFGENKVQELVQKAAVLPDDIRWHMIGHLQRNKVKYLAPFIHLIHSVDSDRVLKEIDKQAAKHKRTIRCLLQIFIADEVTKFGFDRQEALDYLGSTAFEALQHIKIIGLMGMATNTPDQEKIRHEFRGLRLLAEQIDREIRSEKVEMKELSMGMTNDYQAACEEGSTMVRIGSAIFGARNHPAHA